MLEKNFEHLSLATLGSRVEKNFPRPFLMKRAESYFSINENNLSLLRLLAVSLIVSYHCYPLSLGHGTVEPLTAFLHFHLGTIGVCRRTLSFQIRIGETGLWPSSAGASFL